MTTSSQPMGDPADPAPAGLLERLGQLPDPRKRRGRWHPYASVLAGAATAAVGGDSVTAVAEWAGRASQEVLAALGVRRDP